MPNTEQEYQQCYEIGFNDFTTNEPDAFMEEVKKGEVNPGGGNPTVEFYHKMVDRGKVLKQAMAA